MKIVSDAAGEDIIIHEKFSARIWMKWKWFVYV